MGPINYYRLLGVARNASQAEIRKAYRALVLQFHPDRNPGQESDDRFKALNEAYRTLSNESLRVKYDLITANEDMPRVAYTPPAQPTARPAPRAQPRPAPAPDYSAPRAAESSAPRPRPAPARGADRGLKTYLSYQSDMNELDPWDGVLGIVFGISATLFAHSVWRSDGHHPQFVVLFLWMLVPLFIGPTGYTIGKKFETLLEEGFDLKDSTAWYLVAFTKTLPMLFPLLLCSAAVVASQFFRAGVFTWRILPGAIAAGLCAIGGSGVGRAFVLPSETTRGRMFGATLGALIGFFGGGLAGLMLGLISAGRGMDIVFFEGFFSAGFGGAVGGAIASFVGSLRSFRPGDEDEAF